MTIAELTRLAQALAAWRFELQWWGHIDGPEQHATAKLHHLQYLSATMHDTQNSEPRS